MRRDPRDFKQALENSQRQASRLSPPSGKRASRRPEQPAGFFEPQAISNGDAALVRLIRRARCASSTAGEDARRDRRLENGVLAGAGGEKGAHELRLRVQKPCAIAGI